MSDFLKELNSAQKEAVTHIDGPIMVIAGAGSGKTRVLTYRIANLIDQGKDAFNILALTFTNKAALEMKKRIGIITNNTTSQNLWMGTFHSVFSKILRFESEKLNYSSNFTIYDTSDSKNLIKLIVKELNLDKDIYKPNILMNRISNLKNNIISIEGYLSNNTLQAYDESRRLNEMGAIYRKYQKKLLASNAMDFDDLLLNTYILLRDFPEVLNKYQNKFKYILVDEYQDTNHVQYMILKRLAAMNENICVVGDDAQSIYSFRGANIQNIFKFRNDYPDLKTVKLEQNYRSTQNIVNAANSLIQHNKNQIDKIIFSKNSTGELIRVCKTISDSNEGYIIGQSIFENHINLRLSYDDFAILYRTNAQSRSLEEALRKRNIPYRIYGGLSFYQRKEVKDLLAYFRLMINPQDEEALKRVINYPSRGIGATTIQKLVIASNNNKISIWKCIENPLLNTSLGVKPNTLNKIQSFVTLINSFKAQLKVDAYDLAEHIAKSTGLLNDLHKDKTPEGISRYENIQELLNAIKDFTEKNKGSNDPHTLDHFMQDVALITDQDESKTSEKNKVTLMTIHASKGLEFPCVYLAGLEENLFPSQMSIHSREDLEEERRLFYVGITRAEKFLQLSYSTSRWRWGQLIDCEPSRFLQEIDESYLDWKLQIKMQKIKNAKPKYKLNSNNNYYAKKQTDIKTKVNVTPKYIPNNLSKLNNSIQKKSRNNDNNHLLKSGMKVEHERFGKGTILTLEGLSGSKKAVIFFEGVGQKQLLLKFAKLKIIN